MITLNNVTMGFTQRTLFKDVTLSIFKNEKIGLTGPNGAGKTTLFHLILADMEPVEGSVQIQKNLNIGYLPQETHFDSTRTVLEELTKGDSRIKAFMDEKRKLEDEGKADSPRYGDILHELEQAGIYELEHKAEKILSGLGFSQSDFHKPIKQLSGGWQMRTFLAKLLVYPYDALLLDEPTNYLDLPATLWLKDFLAAYPGTFVLISHDKVFLNDVTNYTIVLDAGKITKVKGNYEAYEEQKQTDLKTLEKKQKVVEKRREQLERFTQRFHAQPNRAAAVRNKRKMLERLEEIVIPQETVSIGDFEFPPTTRSGHTVISLEKISKSYADKKVYDGIDLEVTRGQKVCLVGPNGAGKSTLLKMLAGVVSQDSGEIKYGHQVQLGYFSQTRLDVLNPERNAFEEVASVSTQTIPALKIRTLLGIFNFRGDDVFKPVKVLSGGEKSRLILAKLLIQPPNFILLDEPTTHLDIDGVEALTKCFQAYDGTLCFISHDLYFIQQVANYIIEVNNGQLTIYSGGLDYYLEKKANKEAHFKEGQKQKKVEEEKLKEGKQPKERHDEDHKFSHLHRAHKVALARVEEIKKEIKLLEKEQKELETESYVKARFLGESYGKDKQVLKEYGQRLKYIQERQREIEATIKKLREEKEKISK